MRPVLLLAAVATTTGTLVVWGTLDILLRGPTLTAVAFVLLGVAVLLSVAYDALGIDDPTAWLFADEVAWFLLVCLASVAVAVLVPFGVELLPALSPTAVLVFLVLPALAIYGGYLVERLSGRDPKRADPRAGSAGSVAALLDEE